METIVSLQTGCTSYAKTGTPRGRQWGRASSGTEENSAGKTTAAEAPGTSSIHARPAHGVAAG